jgi:hypothetical protein
MRGQIAGRSPALRPLRTDNVFRSRDICALIATLPIKEVDSTELVPYTRGIEIHAENRTWVLLVDLRIAT